MFETLANAATTTENRECVQGKGGKMPVAEKTEQHYPDEMIIEIELERLRSFTNHPFKSTASASLSCEMFAC